jgi:CRISPR-associated protein Csm5
MALTPIHIGTGQEIDPFSFIIKEGIFYRYDINKLMALLSPDERGQIEKAVRSPSMGARKEDTLKTRRLIYELFNVNAHKEAVLGSYSVHSQDLTAKYESEIIGMPKQQYGRIYSENTAINRLAIYETSRDNGVAYIPGSSLKGAIRTAFLKHFELQDDMNLPFNMLSLSDAKPKKPAVELGFFLNYYKGKIFDGAKDNLTTFTEVLAGSYWQEKILNQFIFDINIKLNYAVDGGEKARPDDIRLSNEFINLTKNGYAKLFEILNSHYLKLLEDDYEVFKGYPENKFTKIIEKLFLLERMKKNEIAVIRVGRHSGKEAMVIDIKEEDIPKTVWYFSLKNAKNARTTDISPVGWLVIAKG